MTARPMTVGARVRVLAPGTHEGKVGTVVEVAHGTFLPVSVYLDEEREALGFNEDELELPEVSSLRRQVRIPGSPLDALRAAGHAAARRTADLAEPYRYLEEIVEGVSEAVESLRLAREFSLADHLNGLRKSLEVSEEVLARLVPAELPLAGVAGDIARVTDCLAQLVVRHESSPLESAATVETSQHAEASEPPQRDTATVGDRSDAAGRNPRLVAAAVGGRAEPPVPAPADTTTSSAPLAEDPAPDAFPCAPAALSGLRPRVRGTDTRIGAASAPGVAPITDLTALRDAAYRLRDVRAEIDRLLDLEEDLAEVVGDGLGQVVGVPVDLTWGWPTEVDA